MSIKKLTAKKLNQYKKKSKFIKNLKGGGVIDLSAIKKIEGPVYVGVLEPLEKLNSILKYKAPTILLLGDFHKGSDECKEGCEPSKGCYSLYENEEDEDKHFSLLKYLDIKARSRNQKIDLFVESWYNDANAKINTEKRKKFEFEFKNYNNNPVVQNSALTNVLKLSLLCHNERTINSKCPFTNIRIHMSDPRQNINIIYILEIFEFSYDTIINEKQDMLLLPTLIYMFSKKIYPHIEKDKRITEDYLFELIIKIIKGYTINEFINEPFFQLTNKALKQYKTLLLQSPEIATKILTNANNENIYLYNDHRILTFNPFTNNENLIIEYFKQKKNLLEIKKHILSHITMFEVDLHTVCRLLKKPKEKDNINNIISSLSIIYLGLKHISNINILLKDLYNKIFENPLLDNENTNDENTNDEDLKCINTDKIPSSGMDKPSTKTIQSQKNINLSISDLKKKGICNLFSKL